MFSGITNDDASLPGSHSVIEEERVRGRDVRQKERKRRRGRTRGKEGGEEAVNRRSRPMVMVITHIQLSALLGLILTLRGNSF